MRRRILVYYVSHHLSTPLKNAQRTHILLNKKKLEKCSAYTHTAKRKTAWKMLSVHTYCTHSLTYCKKKKLGKCSAYIHTVHTNYTHATRFYVEDRHVSSSSHDTHTVFTNSHTLHGHSSRYYCPHFCFLCPHFFFLPHFPWKMLSALTHTRLSIQLKIDSILLLIWHTCILLLISWARFQCCSTLFTGFRE